MIAATAMVPTPPITTENTGPTFGNGTRLERAKFIRRPDEEAVERGHTPAHVIGRRDLHQGRPDNDADVVAHPEDEEHGEGQWK